MHVGVSGGLVIGGLINAIVEIVPSTQTSEATGLAVVMRTVAMAIGSQVVAQLLASSTVSIEQDAHYPSHGAYVYAFSYITVMVLLGLLAALYLPHRHQRALREKVLIPGNKEVQAWNRKG